MIRSTRVGLVMVAILTVPKMALAAGALAVGYTGDVVKDGISYAYQLNQPNQQAASTAALDACRKKSQTAPRAAALCRVVATASRECVAVAFDPKAGTPGAGWSFGPTKAIAERRAVEVCRMSAGPDRLEACVVDNSACDEHD